MPIRLGSRAARCQRLEHHRGIEAGKAGAAAFLPHIQRRHAKRRGLTQRVDREVLFGVPAQRVRCEAFGSEGERGLPQRRRRFRQVEERRRGGLVERHGGSSATQSSPASGDDHHRPVRMDAHRAGTERQHSDGEQQDGEEGMDAAHGRIPSTGSSEAA